MKRVVGVFVFVAVLGAAAIARPHVVDRYALYLGEPHGARPAHLFLDPFPNEWSCETRVRAFEANKEHAFCTGRHTLEIGAGDDALLAADFNPFFAPAWLCTPRTSTGAQQVAPRIDRAIERRELGLQRGE